MMKKTGAGLLWPRAALFLLGVCLAGRGPGAFALEMPTAPEMPQAAAPDAPAPAASAELPFTEAAAPEAVAESAPRIPASERLESLKSADLETLKAAQADCMKAAGELTEKVPALREQMRTAYEDARLNSPEAKALHQQIRDLEAKLEQTLRDAPAVKEQLQAIEQAQKDVLAELQLRTALEGMIAAKEDAAKDPAQISE
jgi:hypothetical protein